MYQHNPPLFDSQSSSDMAKVVSNSNNSNSSNNNSGNGSLGKVVPAMNDDETWIEVSNKSNQTPSHWVYDDMITKEQVCIKNFQFSFILESIIPNFDFFVFPIFAFKVQTIFSYATNTQALQQKNGKNHRFTKKKVW
jgi:hypothetical protein